MPEFDCRRLTPAPPILPRASYIPSQCHPPFAPRPTLQVAERGPLAAALPGDGIDRRLAAAQQAVVDGELLAAAAELEKAVAGTAAAPVVARWANAVRLRAVAEQSAALLEAHAAAETASLA